MKNLLFFICIIIFAITNVNAQKNYHVHTCKSGHCGILHFGKTNSTPQKFVLSNWTEPIKISVGIQDGVSMSNSEIEAQIAEDSQIAIDDGLYTGLGPAYILSNTFSFSPNNLLDAGFPFIINSVSLSFSTIDFQGTPNVGTIYDDIVLNNRECYGSHITYVIVDNNTSGVQETSTNFLTALPDDERNPTIVFKRDAFLAVNFRNHGITHAAGGNSGDHQDGPDVSQRPIQIGNDKSYGWSTTGLAGFSGGNNLGIGPQGENLAGHICDGFNSWLQLIPNLTSTLDAAPSSLELGENGNFSASINKDIGNENWTWTFSNGGNTMSASGSDVSVSFDVPGNWTYEVTVSNDCGGQTDTLSGSFLVNDAQQQAPVANCQSITLQLGNDGTVSVPASSFDNGSFDPDGKISSLSINGQSSLNFACTDVGNQDITFTVTDNDGLSSTCQTTVTIEDTTPPTISCNQEIILQASANEDITLTLSDIGAADDNCSINLQASQLTFNSNESMTFEVILTATDFSGNTDMCTVDVILDITSTTIDISKDNRIKVFPNPTADMVNIRIEDSLDVREVVLLNGVGREIATSRYSPQISVENMAKGVFYLQIVTTDDVFIQKMLKL